MRRIMIVGSPGAGKTTLALALGRRLGVPVYHLDAMYWLSRGRQRPPEQFEAELERILSGPDHIVEGSYEGSYPARLSACDTLVWLDLPLWLRLFRVWCRYRRARRKGRPDVPAGPRKPMTGGSTSIFLHVLQDHGAMRVEQVQLLASAPATVRVFHLQTPRAVRAFLDGIGAEPGRTGQ
jgi:hypothetical protein